MAPIFGFDRTSDYAESVAKNAAGASSALFGLANITAVPGGVAIKRGNVNAAPPWLSGVPVRIAR